MASLLDIPGEIMVLGVPSNMQSNFVNYKSQDKWKDLIEVPQKSLKMPNPIQETFAAGMETGIDIFLVDAPENQDEFPIYLSFLLERIVHEQPKQHTVGTPSAIILCPSIKRGLELTSKIRQSFKMIKNMPNRGEIFSVQLLEHIPEEPEDISDLVTPGPVDILILTGAALANLFSYFSKTKLQVNVNVSINFQRLQYLVIEELVMKHKCYSDGVTDLLRYMKVIKGKISCAEILPRSDLQLVFTGSIWNDSTEELHSLLTEAGRKSIKILSSPVHILQYRRDAEWEVYHAKEGHSEKLKILLELCKEFKVDMSEEKLMVVACSSSLIAKEVSSHLSKEGGIRNVLKTKHDQEVCGIFNKHFDGLGTIYIVADNAWDQITLDNVSSIVHFEIDGEYLPATEPFFQKRYSCMWNKLRLPNKLEADAFESPIVSHFLVSGTEKNLAAFITFYKTVKMVLPSSLEQLWSETASKESLKLPLCTILKCFGICNVVECPERHSISQEDLDETAVDGPPGRGEVAFKVIKAINPSLYLGRLSKFYYFDDEDRRILGRDYKVELKNREKQMEKYYSVETNRKRPIKVTTNGTYGLHFLFPAKTSKTYVRVKLADWWSPKSSNKHENGDIPVFCIDVGITVSIHVKNLLELPAEFQKWPMHCVQVVLSNLLPIASCNNEYLSEAVRATNSLTQGKTWHGRILVAIRNTIWINPMVQLEKDPVTGHPTQGCNLACELVTGGHATILNTHAHMMIISELIKKQDPNYPEILHEFNIDEDEEFGGTFYGKVKGDFSEWLSISECPEVKDKLRRSHNMLIQAWVNPWEIYVTPEEPITDDHQTIPQLEIQMSTYIEERLLPKHLMNPSILTDYLGSEDADPFGTVVGVKTDMGKWHRAIILRKLEEEDVSEKFDAFLVDYGITLFGLVEIEEVVPLLSKFVSALPFQVMCLKLAHIQPTAEEADWNWGVEEMAEFKSLMSTSRQISVFVTGKVEGANFPCNYYEAVAVPLKNDFREEEIGIQLVNAEEAQCSPTCNEALTIIQELLDESHEKSKAELWIETEDDDDDEQLWNDENGINWENFLREAEDSEEVEEPGSPIKEALTNMHKTGNQDWNEGAALLADELQGSSSKGKDAHDSNSSDEWDQEVENSPKTLSLAIDQEIDYDDSDQEFHVALDEDQSGSLTISPEEEGPLRKLCQLFMKNL